MQATCRSLLGRLCLLRAVTKQFGNRTATLQSSARIRSQGVLYLRWFFWVQLRLHWIKWVLLIQPPNLRRLRKTLLRLNLIKIFIKLRRKRRILSLLISGGHFARSAILLDPEGIFSARFAHLKGCQLLLMLHQKIIVLLHFQLLKLAI